MNDIAEKLIDGWGKRSSRVSRCHMVSCQSDFERFELESFSGIARGQGRSYGDSAIAEQVIDTSELNYIIQFDQTEGLLTCHAGCTLNDILQVIVPKGWFLPVTPGTKFVSVGGAIASDVHGKNHHLDGTFTKHVLSVQIYLGEQGFITCSPDKNSELFYATCGGMGLTGVIYLATFKLISIFSVFINQRTLKAKNLEEVMALFEENKKATYSVAWVDCLAKSGNLGRSLLMQGEHDVDRDFNLPSKINVDLPFDVPSFLLNRFSVKAFNFAYYNKVLSDEKQTRVSYDSFFYPLDAVANWNRMYGKAGFFQYQFVLPQESSLEGMRAVLHRIANSGMGSFLSTLKQMGDNNEGLLSFPMKGYTLAIDFKYQAGLISFLMELDIMVLSYGGRVYLTKDNCLQESTFKQMYPGWEKLSNLRHKMGIGSLFVSQQSIRLGIE